MDIRVVEDPVELRDLHGEAAPVVTDEVACSPDSGMQPQAESLVYYGEAAVFDVVAGYLPDASPAAYVVVDRATGRINWLVLFGEVNATAATAAAVCQWCLEHYGSCWGEVANDAIRALFAQPGAIVEGTLVRWVGV